MDLATVLITVIKPAKEDEQCSPCWPVLVVVVKKSFLGSHRHHITNQGGIVSCFKDVQYVLGMLQIFALFIFILIDKIR